MTINGRRESLPLWEGKQQENLAEELKASPVTQLMTPQKRCIRIAESALSHTFDCAGVSFPWGLQSWTTKRSVHLLAFGIKAWIAFPSPACTQPLLTHSYSSLSYHTLFFACTCTEVLQQPPHTTHINFSRSSLPANTPHRWGTALRESYSRTWSHSDPPPSIFCYDSSWQWKIPGRKHSPLWNQLSSCSTLLQFNNFKVRWWTRCKQRPAKLWSIVFDNKVTSPFSLFNLTLGLPITVR